MRLYFDRGALEKEKSKNLVFFHGTSAPNLTEFKIGIKSVGECATPVNGIWLSENFTGARWHAGRASNVIKQLTVMFTKLF